MIFQEVPALARRLFDLTGSRPWRRRFEWLEREFAENEYMHPWLQQHCAIELAMKDALESESTGCRPSVPCRDDCTPCAGVVCLRRCALS